MRRHSFGALLANLGKPPRRALVRSAQTERPFMARVECSACNAKPAEPCKSTCPRRPYPAPIVEVK